MFDYKSAIYIGSALILGALMLPAAALWSIVFLLSIAAVYAYRKSIFALAASEQEIDALNQAIHQCSFQCSLLAMNAAVEVARSGPDQRELVQRMERAARDTRSMVERKINSNISRSVHRDIDTMGELTLLLEESNRALSVGPLEFDPQLLQNNVVRIEHFLNAA
ncbi:MAG: hypothetical protein JXR25_08880 [Pontiellaceae bacterium]|nr:hypothetical protein [Pontiellaceae bacterium]MBN2784929.1 hypothetical protein [Pontiellaceae bacterium]